MFKHNLKAVLNTQRPTKDNKFSLRIRSTIKRKVTYYPTGINLALNQWDGRQVTNHPNKSHLNLIISMKLSELEKEFVEKNLSGETVMDLKRKDTKDFFEYARKHIERCKTDAPATTRAKNESLATFKDFQSKVLLSHINPPLLYRFEDYCRGLGLKENTVWKKLKYIKHWTLAAYREGLYKTDPLINYKRLKYRNPEREFLNDQELKQVEKVAMDCEVPEIRAAANWFLFSCYSGLRYSDASKVDLKGIGEKIILRTTKTGSDVSIKVHPALKAVIARIDTPIPTNAALNRLLKLVGVLAGLKHPLTMHQSRHSFSVMWLENSGSIETLSKLLGHSSVKTTQIYARITDKKIDDEVDRVFK